MPMHLVFISEKAFKVRLGANQIILRIFQPFLEFILFSPELILFTRRLSNLFHELQILYLGCSCLNLSLGIFLEFLEFPEYFSCIKNIF